MNRKMMFALVLVFAVLLVGCNGNVSPTASATTAPATAEPTVVIPTEVPTNTAVPTQEPTATVEPTATPTEVLTPTATPIPTVWEIADQMLAECTGAHNIFDAPSSQWSVYLDQLRGRVYQLYPDFDPETVGGLSVTSSNAVLADDGKNPSPFAFVDYPLDTELELTAFETTVCEGFVLAYDLSLAENGDGDGILAGEAYLFYEVGGTQPYVLDGELKEVHFTFEGGFLQEARTAAEGSLEENVGAVASQDCSAVFPADLEGEELDNWMNQYLDRLSMEALGEEHFPLGSEEIFLLPLGENLECVVVLYRDAVSGESFLIYETADGIVKVPFEIPSGQ